MASGTAIVAAGDKVIEQGKQIAAYVLEAAVADIEFARGRFTIVGTDRSIGIMELAEKLRAGLALPDGLPQTLDVRHVSEALPSAFPTAATSPRSRSIPRPASSRSSNTPWSTISARSSIRMLVEGQLHGGVVQGIGQALMERTVYDAEGQLITGSYMDYAMPRAADVPSFEFTSHPVPAKTNPLGVKGCGEAGCAGALPSVMNAVVDALSDYGIRHIDMPATPQRMWQAIDGARRAG